MTGLDARQIAMNFCVGPVSRGDDHREVLARIPAAVGVHRVVPVVEAAAEVVAAGERASRAAQHDHLDGGVAFGKPDGLLDLVGHRRHDGVEVLRAVQRDGGDGTVRLVQNRLELRRRRHSSSRVTSVSESRRHPSRRPYRKLLSMLRVVQWATGTVGRHAVAAVHEHPDLELVGALVYSDAKAGRDVGDICGIGPIGVTATKDPDEIVAARRRLRALHAAGRDEPDGRARRHLPAARVGQERGVHGGDRRSSIRSASAAASSRSSRRPAREEGRPFTRPASNPAGRQRFCR